MSKKRGMFSSDEEPSVPESSVQKDPEPDAKPAAESTTAALAEAAAEAPKEPARELPMITCDVFCQASGKKPDQAKAFAGWARRESIKALTMPGWHEQWQKFQNRPV